MLKTLIVITAVLSVVGCSDARVASHNLSKAAEMFELERRVVFYNGITDEYILSIEGRCSLEHLAGKVAVTCKTGEDAYKKHQLGLSDNVTYFSEQLIENTTSVYHYRVIFKPQAIVPNIDLEGEI